LLSSVLLVFHHLLLVLVVLGVHLLLLAVYLLGVLSSHPLLHLLSLLHPLHVELTRQVFVLLRHGPESVLVHWK
jgi:hypothetical protein